MISETVYSRDHYNIIVDNTLLGMPSELTITANDIDGMSYTDFIAFLRETNRCPGGKRTIRRIRELVHIDRDTKVLDVGSNTGFNSFELAHITPAQIYGIDVSSACVEEADRVLQEDIDSVKARVNFQVASAYEIPFPDDYFDILMVGGATSFMEDKSRAIKEYLRVLRPWKFLVSTPLVYHTTPPQSVVDSVSSVLGVKIQPMTKEDWLSTVSTVTSDFELYANEFYQLSARSQTDINTYIEYFMRKAHIRDLPPETVQAIRSKWAKILEVFNENHKYLGYTIAIFRKRIIEEESELFITA